MDDALGDAIRRGDDEAALSLIGGGADVDSRDGNGWTALTHAAYHGRQRVVEALLSVHGARCGDGAAPAPWYSALLFAVVEGHEAVVRALIDAGADVSFRYGSEPTLLMVAADRADPTVALMLIEAGADVNTTAEDGWRTALIHAVAWGNEAVVEALLAAGADVTVADVEGRTPLRWAEGNDAHAIAALLRQAGAER